MKQHSTTAGGRHKFYARHFSRKERAPLSDLGDPLSLDGEIALLRLLIQRELARPPIDEGQSGYLPPRADVSRIIRYVHTLCRIVKARPSPPSALDGAASDALKEILNELRHASSSQEEEDEGKPSRTVGTPTPGLHGLRPPVDHLPSDRVADEYCRHSHQDPSVSSVTQW